MSHTIYAAKFEQTIIHQPIHLRRESQSHEPVHVVRLTSINLQKKILKNPVFKSTFIFLDVY